MNLESMQLLLASEAATLKYIGANTSIPVPPTKSRCLPARQSFQVIVSATLRRRFYLLYLMAQVQLVFKR